MNTEVLLHEQCVEVEAKAESREHKNLCMNSLTGGVVLDSRDAGYVLSELDLALAPEHLRTLCVRVCVFVFACGFYCFRESY